MSHPGAGGWRGRQESDSQVTWHRAHNNFTRMGCMPRHIVDINFLVRSNVMNNDDEYNNNT